MRRSLDLLYAASGAFAALCLAAIFVLMLAQALGREVGLLIRGADDLTAWLCAASAFFALAHTFRDGELVRVGLLVDGLQGRARAAFELFALGITAAFVGYMLWAVSQYMLESARSNYVTQGLLVIPEWAPQVSFLLGALMFFIAILDEIVVVVRGGKPSYRLAEESRRARGDFSDTV